MSETLFSLEFIEFGKEDSDPFANCITNCVPRIGETVSLYLATNEGYQSFTVIDLDYMFDCRTTHTSSWPKTIPIHWGMQPVSITVEKI